MQKGKQGSRASPTQAAAIAAAIGRFQRATAAPTTIDGEEPSDPWIHAAILEGVTREPEFAFPASG